MPLFSKAVRAQVDAIAAKSRETLQETKKSKSANSVSGELRQLSKIVQDYFKDSKAICIRSKQELHDYVTKCIESGYAGIDTETTGLDRIHDWVVGASLYYPSETSVECYIPMKHLVPIFDKPYDNQLTYEEVGEEFQRLADAKTKMIFANADFDLSMIWKDLKVDFNEACYFDVILAWRCLKENEPKNDLKSLYNKYVLRGTGDPKRFSDFFTPQLFPYCDPEIAKLYAANDAKITFELFKWQLKYLVKDNKYCKAHHLERIADLVWNVEFPLISVCQDMFRTGIYLDKTTAKVLQKRYHEEEDREMKKLQDMVQEEIDKHGYQVTGKKMFLTGKDFNPKSPPQVNYLLYDLMKLPKGKNSGTGKDVLHDFNLPITNQILKVRSLGVLINTFVDKMPAAITPDSRIHAQFKQIGADTGRLSSASPNLMNIPSHATDIRHLFRATAAQRHTDTIEMKDNILQISLPTCSKFVIEDNKILQVDTLKVNDKLVLNDELGSSIDFFIAHIHNSLGQIYIDLKTCSHEDANITINWESPSYVMMSSDYSQQEPKILAFISSDSSMIKAFQEGKDIYASIASVSFKVPYEECLEFHPVTHEYQKEGKKRRSEAKTILLGTMYGRSIPSIADQLYGTRNDMTQEEKVSSAQEVYDAVMNGFPALRKAMLNAQNQAKTTGFVQTILGRRRHLPDMTLPEFEFKAMPGYINPDIDPLDPSTLDKRSDIPDRIIKQLTEEFSKLKYYGQIVKRTKQLDEEHIRVINNRPKITDATRQCLNSAVQGSAADMTKMAILNLANSKEWKEIGARLLVCVHDELIAEVPFENRELGEKVLAKLMIDAADFLPFSMKCDVETSYRWYGLEAPCPYKKATSIDTQDEKEIKWLQYHLVEMEYLLPVIKDESGEARGNAAYGVNGIRTDEMEKAIFDYMSTRSISSDEFIDRIEQEVSLGY